MKRILFVGAITEPLLEPDATCMQKFVNSGENSGNLLIGRSLRDILKFDHHLYGTDIDPAQAKTECDIIVVAAANFINPHLDMTWLSSFVERCDLPCMVVGLGAQSPGVNRKIENLPSGTKRLLAVLAERTKTIGVRGAYTAEVLTQLGINNTQQLGCPSLFRTQKRNLRILKPAIPADELRVSLNGSRNVFEYASSPESAREIEKKLIQLSLERGYEYVLQNELPEIPIAYRQEEDRALHDEYLGTIAQWLGLSLDSQKFRELIESKFRIFFNLNDWDTYIRQKDFSIGTRFHGNLIALTNGIPAVIIAHDSRTKELCDLMRIPHFGVEDTRKLDPEKLYSLINFSDFENQYVRLYDQFADFLTEAGLEHRLEK